MDFHDITLYREDFTFFEDVVKHEEIRRTKASAVSMAELETNYFGPEVGHTRRALNDDIYSKIKKNAESIFDYGCGTSVWKEGYWPKFKTIWAAEINKSHLEDIKKNYPQAKLALTKNGLIDCSKIPQKFDVVYSSSVVGYIYPLQAEYHVKACYDLLKNDGQFVITRVRAFCHRDLKNFSKISLMGSTAISCAYTVKDLKTLLSNAGFKKIEYYPSGAYLPISDVLVQKLYQKFPKFMVTILPRIFPFFKIYHTMIAYK